MLRRSRLSLLCAGVALAAFSLSASAGQSRTWTAGKAKVTGEFVSIDKDKAGRDIVTIRKADGKEVEVPLSKLDPVDQAYAKKAAEDAEGSPFKEKGEDDSPFEEKDPGDAPMANDGDAAPVKARTVTVDWNAAQAVDPQPEAEKWAGAVKPEQLVEGAPALKPKTVRLPNRKDFFEKPTDVLFSPAGEKGAVGYSLQKPGSQDATTRIALFDAKTGKTLGSGETPGEYLALGVENDGRRMLVRKTKFGFGENDQLEVWTLGKSGIQKGLQWKPHDTEQGPKRDIKWGTIVADGKGLTLGASGRLALWNLETGEPAWYLDVADHTPGLSPNGKYLAYAAEESIGLLDLAAGKVVALLPTEKLMVNTVAISPDGKYVAASTPDTLWIWDVATGDLYREINVSNLGGFRNIVWADPEYVLLGASFLIHAESRIAVWQYTGATNAQAEGGIVWFYVSSPGSGGEAVVGADLPSASASGALKQAMADPNFFLLKPGSAVSLDISGIPDPDRSTVTAMLQKSITAAGFKIANGSPVTVKASMSRGEEREISYHTFGSFKDEKYKVREYVLDLQFVAEGKTAWQGKTVNLPAPFFVHLKQGQTMADLLKEYDKPGYEFFERLRLPKFVPRPSDRPVLGTSAISMQGVR